MKEKMRRRDRLLSDEVALRLLRDGEYGVMATIDSDNQLYGVPLSYVLYDDQLYFHGALTGTKLNNIENNNKVSFTVVGKTKPIYDNDFTTYFESVIAFGEASMVTDEQERILSLTALTKKYLPEFMDKMEHELEKSLNFTCVFKMSIDQLTGKEKTVSN